MKGKYHFQKIVSRSYTVLMDDLFFNALTDVPFCRKITKIPLYTHNFEDVGGDFFFDTVEVTAAVKKLQRWPLRLFHTFARHGSIHGERLVWYARNIESVIQKQSPKQVFLQSTRFVQKLFVFLPITHTLSLALETKLRTILVKHGVREPQLTKYVFYLSRPKKKNGPILEAEAFTRLVVKARKFPKADFTKELQHHADRFGYLGYREPFSPGWDMQFFRRRLQKELQQKRTSKKHRDVPFPVRLNTNEQTVVDMLQEYVYFRNYRTEKLYEALFFIEPLWRSLAKKYRLSSEHDLSYYCMREVLQLFHSGEKVSAATLTLRKAGFAAILHENTFHFLFGKKFKKRQQYHQQREQTSVSTLQGMPAQKGIVRGKVKVVLRITEQRKVRKGYILVMTMTTPDYLSVMHRAAAFVTDEGGITSHASIVAREMNKPCIIGTKVATKLLKDGDLVEVDADNGIVKKLS